MVAVCVLKLGCSVGGGMGQVSDCKERLACGGTVVFPLIADKGQTRDWISSTY